MNFPQTKPDFFSVFLIFSRRRFSSPFSGWLSSWSSPTLPRPYNASKTNLSPSIFKNSALIFISASPSPLYLKCNEWSCWKRTFDKIYDHLKKVIYRSIGATEIFSFSAFQGGPKRWLNISLLELVLSHLIAAQSSPNSLMSISLSPSLSA